MLMVPEKAAQGKEMGHGREHSEIIRSPGRGGEEMKKPCSVWHEESENTVKEDQKCVATFDVACNNLAVALKGMHS